MAEAKKIIAWLNKNSSTQIVTDEALIGGAAIDEHNNPLPEETLKKAKAADAVLLACIGGPKWDKVAFDIRPEAGLLGIRKEMGLFANLRPAIVFDELAEASTLKKEVVAGLDILILRELTGGLYFGKPAGIDTLPDGTRRGYNTLEYTTPEIERIARLGFELAMKRGKKLCSVDKANVLQSMIMWREEVVKVAKDFPEVELSHLYVDNAAMQLVRNPKQFDVMITENMFGDILSDCASMLTGSLGMLPSASLGAEVDGKRMALYEPVHGSAPDIAGKGIANPLAMILSLSMMLKYSLDMGVEADKLENAVKKVLSQGYRTADIMQDGMKKVSTSEMGEAILKALEEV